MPAGLIDAPNGDTAYVLNTPPTGNPGLVLNLGNLADGAGVWIANVDGAGHIVIVEWSGAHAGIGRIALSGKGDEVWIGAGDITQVTVIADLYPTSIGWAYTDPRMVVHSGQRR